MNPASIQHVASGALDTALYILGPQDGPPVFLMHGFPYDVHAYAEVAPRLAHDGCRVYVPYLRGFGPTSFLRDDTPRSGEQAALGNDLRQLMDALRVERAVLAGYDWGGRAACVVAALWPGRCAGLLSFNSYNIQDIARAMTPDTPRNELSLWYRYYSTASAAGAAWRWTGAACAGCCGNCGRRPGASTTPRSSAAPPPSTTRTSSAS